ncbi:hypothetical protein GCM10017750_40750 [Streptomyces racemochromogenes]
MRTSMAMAGSSVVKGAKKCAGARWCGPRAEGARCSDGRTDGAGEAAQVDVQPRHEQQPAGRLDAHVVGNHAVMLTIPGPVFGV